MMYSSDYLESLAKDDDLAKDAASRVRTFSSSSIPYSHISCLCRATVTLGGWGLGSYLSLVLCCVPKMFGVLYCIAEVNKCISTSRACLCATNLSRVFVCVAKFTASIF
ncbi:unnamed protein product [Choristocarpus tenellus]